MPRIDFALCSNQVIGLNQVSPVIPNVLFPAEFFIAILAIFVVILIWIFWILRLIFVGAARQRLRSWRGPLFALLCVISCGSILLGYLFSRDMSAYTAEQKAVNHPVLTENRRLGGIDMPAGTALDLSSMLPLPVAFQRAVFPHPVMINGVETLVVERYINFQTNDDYRTIGFEVGNLRLSGTGVSTQDGWRCDASRGIVFVTHKDGTIDRLDGCIAAAGNLIEGKPLTKGAGIHYIVRRSADPNLQHEPTEWQISLSDDVIAGEDEILPQRGWMYLSAARKVVDQGAR